MLQCLASATAATCMMAVAAVNAPMWEADYGKALQATRADERPLLVVLDKPASDQERVAPEWLNPSNQSKEQSELLRPYRLCHVDVTTEYGQKVADVFHADMFPYVAIIDKTGSVILHAQAGQVSGQQWQDSLTRYRNGLQPQAVVAQKPLPSQVIPASQAIPAGAFPMENYSTPTYYDPSYCPSCQKGY